MSSFTSSRAIPVGTAWRRILDADFTRGSADVNMMIVMRSEIDGSRYSFQV